MLTNDKTHAAKVAAYFDRIAIDFDSYYEKPGHWFQRWTNEFLRKPVIVKRLALSLQALNQKPNQTILDIGCGSGVLGIPLTKQGHKVIGIDFSGPMVELARQKAKKADVSIEFKVMDFMTDETPKVDSCVALGVLEYFRNPHDIIEKMIACASPGGFVVFDIPELLNYHTPLRLPYLLWRKSRAYFYTPWEARALIKPFKKDLASTTFYHYGAGYLVVLNKK